MSALVANIEFRACGNSGAYVRSGFAEEERLHRWTCGREAEITLPIDKPDRSIVLALCATPCVHPPALTGQPITLAIADRQLANVNFPGLRTYAFRLTPQMIRKANPILTIVHPKCDAPRAPEQVRNGQPLGLAMHSIRLYCLPAEIPCPAALLSQPRDESTLAEAFESLGQGCQFGQIQRQMGADPISLLRFVDTTTSKLTDGILHGFAGVDAAKDFHLYTSAETRPTYHWQQKTYDLSFATLIDSDSQKAKRVAAEQLRRLKLLRRKFLESLACNDKVRVLTRGDCLTEPEALAVFCALNAHGPNTLLWAVHGNPAATGEVVRVSPGFYRAELGRVNEVAFAPLDAWRLVLANFIRDIRK
jgi:hypothetical protein